MQRLQKLCRSEQLEKEILQLEMIKVNSPRENHAEFIKSNRLIIKLQ